MFNHPSLAKRIQISCVHKLHVNATVGTVLFFFSIFSIFSNLIILVTSAVRIGIVQSLRLVTDPTLYWLVGCFAIWNILSLYVIVFLFHLIPKRTDNKKCRKPPTTLFHPRSQSTAIAGPVSTGDASRRRCLHLQWPPGQLTVDQCANCSDLFSACHHFEIPLNILKCIHCHIAMLYF